MGLALPHQFLEELVPVMRNYLIEKSSVFTLTIGSSELIEIKLPIKECMFNSQTVSALINEVTDDNGQDIEGKSIFDSLPALILDGGYQTFGMFMFERDQSITGAESNQDYAMRNINEAVAERIRKYKPDVYDYMVEELCNKNEVVRYLDDNGKVNSIDVCGVKQEEMDNTIESLVKYMLKKYDNLLDVNTILLAGGTGESYYDSIYAYLSEHRDYLVEKTSLPKGTFNGEVVPSVYAVVTGLYKDMILYSNHAYTNTVNHHATNVGTKSTVSGNGTDSVDKTTEEYRRFDTRRKQDNTITVISDMLVLQTSSGDQSVVYFDTKQTKDTQEHYDDIKVTFNEMWTNNSLSASSWKADAINVGSYNGRYADTLNKYKGTGNSERISTAFDNDLAKMSMTDELGKARVVNTKNFGSGSANVCPLSPELCEYRKLRCEYYFEKTRGSFDFEKISTLEIVDDEESEGSVSSPVNENPALNRNHIYINL